MLRTLKPLHGYAVAATDDTIGKVDDFYFHDDTWIVRYMVVDTGHWLRGRKVLIATRALGRPNWDSQTFPVKLTREQIEKSPESDTDKPVSRQHEAELHQYYGWPYYWREPGPAPWLPYPPLPAGRPPSDTMASATEEKGDPHLRSAREVFGYHIRAINDELGHVKDFIVDDTTWAVRYIVVDLSNWFPAKKVLISPQWLTEINYLEKKVKVALTRHKIVNCPEFHPTEAVNREYEARLYDYYGRPSYWVESSLASKGAE